MEGENQMKEAGYRNRVLRIDLSTGKITKSEFDQEFLRKYIGGTGVGIKVIYDEVPKHVKPFDPENRIVFAASPLNGTSAPGSGIVTINTKGAMTGMLSSTQMNGSFGARMRFAGFETIILQGKAPEWSYIYIHDGEVEIRPAKKFVGYDTWTKEEMLIEDAGQDPKRTSSLCIGPSAENGVPFAATIGDHGHVASTNGTGAVLASKLIQGMVVFGSDTNIEVYDKDLVAIKRKAVVENAYKGQVGSSVKAAGSNGYLPGIWYVNLVTVKNYTTNEWPNKMEWTGQKIRDSYSKRKIDPCWGCGMGHCSDATVKEGPAAGFTSEEPEYEALMAWTLNIGNDDIGRALKVHNLHEGLGLDVRESAYCVSLAMECFEKGVITLQDTDGLDLSWGNTESAEKLIEQIAYRKGFGAIFSDGVKKGAERIGGKALDYAVYTGRGTAPHVVDGRGFWLLHCSVAFSDNNSFSGGPATNPEIGVDYPIAPTGDPTNFGKAMPKTKAAEILRDMIAMCYFFLSDGYTPAIELLNAVTGWNMTLDEYLEAAERVVNLLRAYAVINGLTPEIELGSSKRMLSAQTDGFIPGNCIGDVQEQIAREWYEAAGWDVKTCKPLPETLKRLGLDFVIKDLWGEQ